MQDSRPPFLPLKLLVPLAILLSGAAWYLAFDLSGNYGWLMALAPIPVLYTAFHQRPGAAFLTTFIAFTIGRLSWLPYLLSVLPKPVAILFTTLFPLVFALLILPSRRLVLTASPVLSAFALPVFYTAFEFVFALLGRDGSIASIAYTQSNLLPVIQIAAITGIWGISFLLLFIPSVIAIGLFHYRRRRPIIILTAITAILLAAVAIYSIPRLHHLPTQDSPSTFGLATIDESLQIHIDDTNTTHQQRLAELYYGRIRELAAAGASTILLPEKALLVSERTEPNITSSLRNLTDSLHITVIIGYARVQKDHLDNGAWVIAEGLVQTDYVKVNLFEGEVYEGFRPGKDPGIVSSSGVAICKDLDFHRYIRLYSQGPSPVSVLYVPAWDFNRDGWYHSRIAIMRGIENGCYIIRNARQGRQTISDPNGRVWHEANGDSGQPARLFASLPIPLAHIHTLYSRWGDWFGWLTLIAAAIFLSWAVIASRRSTANRKAAHLS